MTWATPFGSEVAQVRSPGSLHNRWCCDPELKPPGFKRARGCFSKGHRRRDSAPCLESLDLLRLNFNVRR
ncbi:hypothetical protein BRM22_25265 [Xanthomonas oryzae pv. oryzae]|nr:hypothetical protein BRM27_12075 [Xanthomonas oryzae pv. oryzae]RBD24834.1 hypothetical protein BRM21_20365 [Xanthomonas oryzae pv. oryzae]RBD70460.1 hypothetical protein BRM19_17535 [Xanthomonas oryzae pv. oryzae]RBG84789.1 hypothetical protein BRM18_20400 [Xanthomonas oryzae pv. oryzae]RBG92150.1 hypothetical protein BRM23_12395 [Xanthomonas oryzae pv. oryzae]